MKTINHNEVHVNTCDYTKCKHYCVNKCCNPVTGKSRIEWTCKQTECREYPTDGNLVLEQWEYARESNIGCYGTIETAYVELHSDGYYYITYYIILHSKHITHTRAEMQLVKQGYKLNKHTVFIKEDK